MVLGLIGISVPDQTLGWLHLGFASRSHDTKSISLNEIGTPFNQQYRDSMDCIPSHIPDYNINGSC